MNRGSRLTAVSLALLAGTLPAAAQERRPRELPDPWLVRARAVSDDLTADAPSLALHDRALLWARLGEVWWNDDERRARALMTKAVEEVEAAPESEEQDARARRLAAARALLSVVGARDKGLGGRLAGVLAAKPKSPQATDGKEAGQNAEALADAGMEVLDADPRRAAELGAASLRAGVSYKLGYLLSRLYKRDAGLAVALFREGLAAARASGSDELLRVLAGEAFPNRLYFPPTLTPIFPEDVRVATVRVLAERLLRAPASEGEENEVCMLAWTAASLAEEFSARLPQQAAAARVVINRCQQKMDPKSRRHLDDLMSEQQPKTVDEYLRAAADAGDERTRGLLLARAAYIAFTGGEPDRAVEIIEGLDIKVREEMGEGWEAWRWEFAAVSALKHFRAGDRQTVRRVLDAVPAELRAIAIKYFLEQLAESKARDFPAEMLGEARLLMTKYERAETGLLLLALVRLYGAYLPADGPLVFNEAVTALNRAARTHSARGEGTPHTWPEYPWRAVALPVALVEADEPGVTSAVAAIDDRRMRALVRLGLLKALLEKRQVESKLPAGRKERSKTR